MKHLLKVILTLQFLGLLASQMSGSTSPTLGPQHRLKLVAPTGYLSGIPLLVRVELRHEDDSMAQEVWDAEAALSTPAPGVALSTNRVLLYNGMGSILVTATGSTDFNLVATIGGLQANRQIQSLAGQPTNSIGGTLPAGTTLWSGIVLVTNDVTVPAGATLTIESNTWVLINGTNTGTVANDILISGTINSQGTESHPVTITCSSSTLRWGQIRHNTAQPSTYRYTIITLGGRASGESGHTGQGPVVRPTNSRITFDGCSITDHAVVVQGAAGFGTPGKIMQASGSDLTFTNCLFARARMGPEISGTALQFLNSYIIDMRGLDDSDGIYLHDQLAGQVIRLAGSVIAGGDDDGIDTLGSNITVEDCVVRGWKFPGDDSKGISVFGGEVRVWRSLLVDNTIGISGKGNNGENFHVRMDRCTVIGNYYGVALTNKSGTTPVPDYHITNCIIRAPDAIFTSYTNTMFSDIHIDYCDVSEIWPGTGNITGNPLFVNVPGNDFRLQPYSPCIDAGDPASPLDADGSPVDIGYLTFRPPPPELKNPQMAANGSFQFLLSAYTNRNYVIDVSADATSWNYLKIVAQPVESSLVMDATATNSAHRLYRARLAP